MPVFTPRQLVVLVLLTLVWGFNWPVMKLGVAHFPPLTFRMASLWLGLPILALLMRQQGLPFAIPRAYWGRVALLALTNMVLWHVLMILAIPLLSSGRAAILGYTMPIFSAVLGVWFFGDRLAGRGWAGVGAALLGVLLLLWHEMGALGSRPVGVSLMLVSAASWALGTQLLRRKSVPVPLLTLSFWMVAITCAALTVLAALFEHERWHAPDHQAWAAIFYNGLLALGFAQTAWFFLVRTLPPVASTLSVMMIPVLGVFSGSLWLGEQLRWQDWTAVALMVLSIGSVLWPTDRK
ncbi:MAG: DMT family transporter [Comamonadaceae bacterium]|nr:DMT family transporter [Pseudomonadota bacterium]MDE2413192.1 DMT family transporter [Comamonadaceae bacterium]